MCFKNLPIDIDDQGRMTLRAEATRAFAVNNVPESSGPKPLSEAAIKDLLARNGYIQDVDFDPGDAGRGSARLPCRRRPEEPPRPRHELHGHACSAAMK